MTTSIQKHEGSKYLRTITGWTLVDRDQTPEEVDVEVDVYAVLVAFRKTCPAQQHAIKKLLACGERDKGDAIADLKGAIAAIERAIELERKRRSGPQPPDEKIDIDFPAGGMNRKTKSKFDFGPQPDLSLPVLKKPTITPDYDAEKNHEDGA